MEVRDNEQIRSYFDAAIADAKFSTCHRSKCGCVIVGEDGEYVGHGFNSQPCYAAGSCTKDNLSSTFKSDKTCCVHAEQRAIMHALRFNPDELPGSTLYFIRLDDKGNPKKSGKPYCTICSKMALDAGIKWFVLWHEEGPTFYDTKEYNELSFQF